MIQAPAALLTALEHDSGMNVMFWLDIKCAEYTPGNWRGFRFRSIADGYGSTPFYFLPLTDSLQGDTSGDGKCRMKLVPKFSRGPSIASNSTTFDIICVAADTDGPMSYLVTERAAGRFTGNEAAWGVWANDEMLTMDVGRVIPGTWDNEIIRFEFISNAQILKGTVPQFEWSTERWERIDDTDHGELSGNYNQSSTVSGSSGKGRWRKGAFVDANLFDFPPSHDLDQTDLDLDLDPDDRRL